MYPQYCLKCSWCLGRFSGSWGWQVAAIQRRPGEVFSQQASCVFGRRCAKLGTVPSALKLSILYWTGMVEWAGWPCNFFCIHRHCSTSFASCRTYQCVKICLERTTSKCSHISCLEFTCMCCRNCLRGSHAIWPLPGWRGWQVAAMQQTAILVFSQQASCVLGLEPIPLGRGKGGDHRMLTHIHMWWLGRHGIVKWAVWPCDLAFMHTQRLFDRSDSSMYQELLFADHQQVLSQFSSM